MKEFLVWLKENYWHQYKDGTWYTIKERAYMRGQPRKFYSDDEVIELYKLKK
jgi:hypothetical protein